MEENKGEREGREEGEEEGVTKAREVVVGGREGGTRRRGKG